MGWTDDPIADFDRWQTEQEEELEKLPVCDECGEPIEDEYLFDLDGEILCQECMEILYRKAVEDYVR